MLGPGRYLLGILELLLLCGFAWPGASQVRRRLLSRFEGTPAVLATSVLTLAILLWSAEILGTLSLFEPVPYILLVAAAGLALRFGVPAVQGPPAVGGAAVGAPRGAERSPIASTVGETAVTGPAAGGPGPSESGPSLPALAISLAIAGVCIGQFAAEARLRLGTGMTGFDSTWYHGPFAAGFHQSGNTIDLHFIAPQFLAWFYPANGEIFHAIGMLAFGRDLLSPLLNLAWVAGCLLACWCIGRPYRVGPWSLALGAIALSIPALADQGGEARNDVVGIFFLLAAVAVAVNAEGDRGTAPRSSSAAAGTGTAPEGDRGGTPAGEGGPGDSDRPPPPQGRVRRRRTIAAGRQLPREARRSAMTALPNGALIVIGLCAGLAAGTKLNFLLPAAVIVLGLVAVAPRGARWPTLAASGLAALAGGGYWYLRNLVHTGNPLPWIRHLGPIDLPSPGQTLGGREAHSVLGYLTDGAVWSDWFLPGLHAGLWLIWPALGLAALAGLLLTFVPRPRQPGRRASNVHISDERGPSTLKDRLTAAVGASWRGRVDPVQALAGLVGLATALAWLVAPTSASGPYGMPRGFESGLRYLAPALILGLALLPASPPLRYLAARFASLGARSSFPSDSEGKDDRGREGPGAGWVGSFPRAWALAIGAALVVLAIAVGYPVERHYLQNRYRNPTFTTPGLDAAFAWAGDLSGARIATTSTRQYPLFGTDLSNRVAYVGTEQPHGGFEAAQTCPEWRRLLNAGNYDYVVASRDRLEPGKSPYPPQARWTKSPQAKVVLKKPPTVVFKLTGRLDPKACPG